jgi:hypothetical protein
MRKERQSFLYRFFTTIFEVSQIRKCFPDLNRNDLWIIANSSFQTFDFISQ